MALLNNPVLTAGVLLASGASRRLSTPKQLLKWQGKYLINHVITEILKSKVDKLFVVLGSSHKKILEIIDPRPTTVINPHWENGKSSSIRKGVLCAEKTYDSILFFPVDQPYISTEIINTLIDRASETPGGIIAPRIGKTLANPVLFKRKYFRHLRELSCEEGGKKIIKTAKDITWVDWDDERLSIDIDTPDDYRQLLDNYSPSSPGS